ncbi:hypothetical protein Q0Z83_060510 [Actinoplanes sichuanensis]|uniref:Uncharacterized protein n=1 Tax=Actinoplanes sichuanensis TaxID=512349 RepID=A0ABW4A7Y9_9ACTN|nr:hypothetical protein [Actinoplanes sichuanensis]BEL07860.1 hypothetical protein Q0Z83_060510 [Actinoplanes sichuanensis]
MTNSLPTPDEMLANAQAELDKAYRALGNAADWLRSDWRPVDSSLTADQARRRTAMQKSIAAAKTAINQGR